MNIPDVSPQLPSRSWRTILSLLATLPQGALSRSFGRIADLPLPRPMRKAVLGTFARSVGIDLSEVDLPLEEYDSLNEFFVRRLRDGVRSWPDDVGVLASPVDGITGQLGRISSGQLLQAKGRWYSVGELLGDDAEARRFEGGSFLTIYLSPRHYHRIHCPTEGLISVARHLPGLLLPVNQPAVAHVPNLFSRNERLLCHVDGQIGRVAVVAVGAYNVGRISASFDRQWHAPNGSGSWVTNRRGLAPSTHRYDPPVQISLGDELMAFHLGSTVVLLLEAQAPGLRADLRPGQDVVLGERLTA
ncbi:archaetidylserine decarboxylase [soil metagenome]